MGRAGGRRVHAGHGEVGGHVELGLHGAAAVGRYDEGAALLLGLGLYSHLLAQQGDVLDVLQLRRVAQESARHYEVSFLSRFFLCLEGLFREIQLLCCVGMLEILLNEFYETRKIRFTC